MSPEVNKLEQLIAESVVVTDMELDAVLPTMGVEPAKLHQAIRHSIFAGGKRFRPMLVFAVGTVFGAEVPRLKRVAAAIEMIHTYSLIHDDLPSMDDDKLRRGRETCHVKFGEATAILAGDALQNLAFQSIAEDENLSAELKVRLISEIGKASGTPKGMVAGQKMDLDAEGAEVRVSPEGLEEIHKSKTGAMITVSARAGAIIAGANGKELDAITNYAAGLGFLFQITDDLLDVTETTETLGKTAGKDEAVEKATYPSFYGIEETRRKAKAIRNESCAELEKINCDAIILAEIVKYVLNRKF